MVNSNRRQGRSHVAEKQEYQVEFSESMYSGVLNRNGILYRNPGAATEQTLQILLPVPPIPQLYR